MGHLKIKIKQKTSLNILCNNLTLICILLNYIRIYYRFQASEKHNLKCDKVIKKILKNNNIVSHDNTG